MHPPNMNVNTSFPPPPTVPFPKPKFPLKTATKQRPSLEIYTSSEKVEPTKSKFQPPRMGALGVIFLALRVSLFACLIGAVALFLSGINNDTVAHLSVRPEFIGGVTVVSLYPSLFP